MRRDAAQVAAAKSRSASSRTTYGSLPPNSRTVFFNARPAAAATERPAGALPVSVTARTCGIAMIGPTAEAGTRSEVKRPSGSPASRKIDSMASEQPETLDACFSRQAFPAIKAGAAKRKTCQKGKFQGITARTTPRGWNATYDRE